MGGVGGHTHARPGTLPGGTVPKQRKPLLFPITFHNSDVSLFRSSLIVFLFFPKVEREREKDEWRDTKVLFYGTWSFPGCLGSSHVVPEAHSWGLEYGRACIRQGELGPSLFDVLFTVCYSSSFVSPGDFARMCLMFLFQFM